MTPRTGDRVQLHPATDAWMQGDRYGEVLRVSKEAYLVKLDKSDRRILVKPEDILEVIEDKGKYE